MGPGSIVAGKYRVDTLAGEGGMGRVFRARSTETGSAVALKVLGAQGRADRFAVEAEALSRLAHPAVVRYVDHGLSDEGEPFLVMEWLEGEGLDMRLAGAGVDVAETLELAERVAEALEYIHARGIVHRDLKPSNVVLRNGEVGQATIVDFGIARVASERALTATGLRLGTLHYMAPEQFFHPRHVDGRADVFALGCILFECLTAHLAFDADDDIAAFARVVLEDAPRVRAYRPEVPEAVGALVARLLSRDRGRRPRANAALRLSIEGLRRDLGESPLGPPTRASLPPDETREIAGAALLGATTLGTNTQLVPSSMLVPRILLPKPAGRLIGRDAEVAHVRGLLTASGGLVTLWGPAGIGKTRLALEVARGWAEEEETRGATFADLRDASDDEGVLRIIASALQPSSPPDGTRDDITLAIERILRARGSFALVLDATEHVNPSLDPLLRRWSAAAGEARFIVTSRERTRLGVGVELGPLAFDGTDSAAAALFFERAGVAAQGGSESRDSVARIVRALDGNPLAIELAAARVDVLGLGPLLARVSRPLELLGTSSTSTHPITMLEALGWSWGLLTDEEKVALARCSVFRGSFTVQAAEALLAPTGGTRPLDLLQSLRDKSLLSSSLGRTAEEARLGMYGAVREFARTKLDELGIADETLGRHAAYYLPLGARLADRVATHGDAASLRALAAEADELLGVFEYASRRSARLTLCALLALDPVLTTRGPFGKHVGMLDEALERARGDAEVGPDLLARARQARGRVYGRLGRHDVARADLEHALEHARKAGDAAAEASALLDLGVLHHAMRDLGAARRHYEAVAVLETESPFVEARALGNLGALNHDQGRFDDAYACYVEAIALFESLGDPRTVGLFLANLAMLDHDRGRLADATRRYARALACLEQAEDPRLLGVALGSLGMLELELGHPELALAHHQRARALLQEVNALRSEALSLGRLGVSLASTGSLEAAASAFVQGERLAKRDPVARDTLRLFRGFLDVARAEVEAAEGRHDDARTALEAVRARIREASEAPSGQQALVAHSDDARAALRLLRPRLAWVEQLAEQAQAKNGH